jgi:hypothetical protein
MEKGCIELGRTGKHGNGGICIPLWRFFCRFLEFYVALTPFFPAAWGVFAFQMCREGLMQEG